jgi:hypothetical protein
VVAGQSLTSGMRGATKNDRIRDIPLNYRSIGGLGLIGDFGQSHH